MKIELGNIIKVVFCALGFASMALVPIQADGKYAGSKACKKCHISKKVGSQYKKWSSTGHSKAFETLASEESLKIAKEKGIADPQKAPECLECHVTAYKVDAALLGSKFNIELGVQCESCHGPAQKHVDARNKAKKAKDKSPVPEGEVLIVVPKKEDCTKCHNDKSPTFKEFDFDKRFKDIAHPRPKK